MRTSLLLSALALVACGGSTPASVDGGLQFDDTGAPDAPDAFIAPDAGDGICGETTSPTGWDPLPATCLPRCTAATRQAVQACTSAANPEPCVTAAVNADTTPIAHVRTPYGVMNVSCAGMGNDYACILWQVFSCQFELCPTEYAAYTRCLGLGGSTCNAEYTTLDSCAHADPGWSACFTPRASACYAAP